MTAAILPISLVEGFGVGPRYTPWQPVLVPRLAMVVQAAPARAPFERVDTQLTSAGIVPRPLRSDAWERMEHRV